MILHSQYRYIDQTTRHVQAVVKNFPALKLTRKEFGKQYKETTGYFKCFNSISCLLVHQNGAKEELACLCGTIPVHIQGSLN